MSKDQQTCDICYQIKCRKCGWIATDEDVLKIQRREMTACPDCGWVPGSETTITP